MHEERKKGNKTAFTCPTKNSDEDLIPHGQQFVEGLTNKTYKELVLNYVSLAFIALSKSEMNSNQQLIIDSPTFDTVPLIMSNGHSQPMSERSNNKGEADFGVWWHAKCSNCSQVIVHASDTDIYMNGIALAEGKNFSGKQVCVERMLHAEYVSINTALESVHQMPEFEISTASNTAGISLLAVYLPSGSDYLSSFYKLSSEAILKVFIKYMAYINEPQDSLVILHSDGTFKGISTSAYMRVMCCAYLEKHLNLYGQFYSNPVELWKVMQLHGHQMSASSGCNMIQNKMFVSTISKIGLT